MTRRSEDLEAAEIVLRSPNLKFEDVLEWVRLGKPPIRFVVIDIQAKMPNSYRHGYHYRCVEVWAVNYWVETKVALAQRWDRLLRLLFSTVFLPEKLDSGWT